MARAHLAFNIENSSSGKFNLDLNRALKKTLSQATLKLLASIRRHAEIQKTPLYFVGGFVRDLLLGRPKQDLDLVVEGDAIRLGRLLAKDLGGGLLVHKAFGTAVWSLDPKILSRKLHTAGKFPEFIDLISARRETYQRPGALPSVEFADIYADQFRRDFAINTLALRLDGPKAGMLLDPFGGVADLNHGSIRVLHENSFSDDPTRILRALRLASRLGFKLESATQRQLKSSLHFFDAVSGERLRTELELILGEPKLVATLQIANKLGVLGAIHPRLRFDKKIPRSLHGSDRVKPALYWEMEEISPTQIAFVRWLMHLPEKDAGAIAGRLQMDSKLSTASVAAARLHSARARLQSLKPSEVVVVLESSPMLSIFALFLATKGTKLSTVLQTYAQKWQHVRPHADGNTLRRRGLPPGPAYSKILTRLRAAWLDGEVQTARQEKVLLDKLIDEHR